MDSAFSVSSVSTVASGPALSSSWGGFGTTPPSPKAARLMRQVSLPGPASAPMDIPGGRPNPLHRASLDYGLLRRTHTVSLPVSASVGAAPSGGAPGGATGPGGDGDARARLPLLVRSLSKGLSESLDFR
jgi:hypothetical protein